MALFDTHREVRDVLDGYHHLHGVSRYGAPGWVDALEVVGGDLVVGGSFDVAGILTLGPEPAAGFPAANVAVWRIGGAWQDVGGTDGRVQALEGLADGTLALAGWFATAGDAAAARVARYDPAARRWTALGSGLSDGERGGSWALALGQGPGGELWVGGEFPVAGGSPSANLARWAPPAGGTPTG